MIVDDCSLACPGRARSKSVTPVLFGSACMSHTPHLSGVWMQPRFFVTLRLAVGFQVAVCLVFEYTPVHMLSSCYWGDILLCL